MVKDNIEVEFACDGDGDHTAPIHECVDSRIRTFKGLKEALSFINKCSQVYNLDKILEVVPEAAPKKSKKLLNFR